MPLARCGTGALRGASCNPPATTRSVTGWLSVTLDGIRGRFLTREMAPDGTRRRRLTRTLLPSHGGNAGSNPVCAATFFERKCRGFVRPEAVAKTPRQVACNPRATEMGGARWHEHTAALGDLRSVFGVCLRRRRAGNQAGRPSCFAGSELPAPPRALTQRGASWLAAPACGSRQPMDLQTTQRPDDRPASRCLSLLEIAARQ